MLAIALVAAVVWSSEVGDRVHGVEVLVPGLSPVPLQEELLDSVNAVAVVIVDKLRVSLVEQSDICRTVLL